MVDARKYKVGLVQMRMGADPEANFNAAVAHIRAAAARGANIVCLPELFRTQYFCQREELALFDLAEPIPGPSTTRLGELARELHIAILASLFERRAPGLYHNTAVTLNADGAIAGVYRKMHIPDDPLYYEKYYFAPGDLGFKAVDTAFGRVGTLVCWDQWYPEGARLTALQGAEVLFYPTAIGWHPAEKDEFGAAQFAAWQTIQRTHAIANGVYVASVNRGLGRRRSAKRSSTSACRELRSAPSSRGPRAVQAGIGRRWPAPLPRQRSRAAPLPCSCASRPSEASCHPC